MRKITLANLETKTLKAFCDAEAKISDLVSCTPVELHTLVRARVRSVVDPKIDTSGQLARYECVNVTGCFNRATVSVLKLMMIIQVYPRFSTLRRRLMKLAGQTIDCYLLQILILRVTLAYKLTCRRLA